MQRPCIRGEPEGDALTHGTAGGPSEAQLRQAGGGGAVHDERLAETAARRGGSSGGRGLL